MRPTPLNLSACLFLMLFVALLAACGSRGKPRPVAPSPSSPLPVAADPCAVVYEHDDADYTAGGLYRPGQRDHAPVGRPDLSRIPEPVPRVEPPSRYGNRSPYTVLGKRYHVLDDPRGFRERGLASWYGAKFHGRATSSMEPYDMCSFSAAHKHLPLPSYARVTNLENGRSAVVRINDRGPFHDGRVIDLSYVAALKLGVYETGTALVEVEAIAPMARLEVPASAPLASDGGYYLQLGAFAERANAQALGQRVRAVGEPVAISEAWDGARRLYRVRVGPLADARMAEEIRDRLLRLGFTIGAIVIGD